MPIPVNSSPHALETLPIFGDREEVDEAERLLANDGRETGATEQDEDTSTRAEDHVEKANEAAINDKTESDADAPNRLVKAATSLSIFHKFPAFFSLSKYHLIIMLTFSAATFVALRILAMTLAPASTVDAVPFTSLAQEAASSLAPSAPTASGSSQASSSYWLSTIQRQGLVPFSNSSSYKVYRSVKDYGAKGDGSTDDTAAINKAITDGNRCGQGCDSSTVTPALVYFPPGEYLVSAPIIQYYYTQLVGDALSIPTLKAAPAFKGMAVIDSDPYEDGGANWYTNQNNFFRQVRNFVIDLTGMPSSMGAGIHWQVAQATSLQNIRFEMVKGGGEANKQQGVFMDNGSGGFMTDLTFNGGNYGMFIGNQQFTTRNLTFNNCNTAVYMNWNWLWNLKSLSINNCGVGVNMSNTPSNMTVGSIIVQDSTFSGTPKGVITAYQKTGGVPVTGNTLIIDNCDFTGCAAAVVDVAGTTILKGGGKTSSWVQGHVYSTGELNEAPSNSTTSNSTTSTCATPSGTASASTVQGTLAAPSKSASLLNNGKVFERSKPQYETVPASSFLSAKANGCKGDGTTDDTAAVQALFNKATKDQIVYFDHGAYVITSTVKVPKDIRMTGEIWPLIMASGSNFASETSPTAVFQVGEPGDSGSVEMSDLIFTTKGPVPGAILVEWNLAESSQGAAGMWDVHMRIGGSAGTELQSDHCAKNPNVTTTADPKCEGAFLLLHVTSKATIYLENNWFWVADHELDLADHDQINIYNGRGVLIESTQHSWLYGTSSEHSQFYNYQVANAKNVYMGIIQSETPYMQSNPNALAGGFKPDSKYSDPDFSSCTTDACKKAWGLRVTASEDVLVYGAGLYSFFDNYKQECLATESCQENMVSIESSSAVTLWGLSTKASTNMVSVDGVAAVAEKDNRDTYCSTIALFEEA